MYTSGSTGKPKGVMIEHKCLFNLILAMQEKYPLTVDDSFLLKTTYTFDISDWMPNVGTADMQEANAMTYCEGNFDNDQDVDGTDAGLFKSNFGRSEFINPCPACGPN